MAALLILALIIVLLVAASHHKLASFVWVVAVALAVALAAAIFICAGAQGTKEVLGGARSRKPDPKKKKDPQAHSKEVVAAAAVRRGEEVDAAAAEPPLAFLASPEFDALANKWTAFDLDGGRAVPTRSGDGIYFAISCRNDPARATVLTPWNLQRAMRWTSGRVYAWVLLDSPEARYAVRAAPKEGRMADLDPERLIAWMRPRLTGVPPHKLALVDYLAHLRSLGVTVATVGAAPDAMVRFDLIDMMTMAERATAERELVKLNEADFEALDWSAYDKVVSRGACEVAREMSGDVAIDLDSRTVSAPKIRTGLYFTAVPHSRSFVTFHTHPAARYRGAKHEPPSDGDLLHIMSGAAYRGLVWHFITAPEGTYIVRPSQLLIEQFRADWQTAEKWAIETYTAQYFCVGGVVKCAARAVDALRDAGFVAYFRSKPCMPMSTVPDLLPDANAHVRREVLADLEAHKALPGATLLAADWARAIDMSHTGSFLRSSWMRARFVGGAIQPMDGHGFGDPADPGAYPIGTPGPLMIFCVEDSKLSSKIPAATIRAVQEMAEEWAWVAFLSSARVMVFRADAAGALEVHGPRVLK